MPAEHWSLALDFAVKWQFHDIRDLAVMKMMDLTTHASTLALQVAAARKHNMEGWYLDAFIKLCERGRPITPEEGELLGMLDVIRISAIRTKLHVGAGASMVPSIYNSLPDIIISDVQRNTIAVVLDLSLPTRPPTPQLSRPWTPPPRRSSWSPNGMSRRSASTEIVASLYN